MKPLKFKQSEACNVIPTEHRDCSSNFTFSWYYRYSSKISWNSCKKNRISAGCRSDCCRPSFKIPAVFFKLRCCRTECCICRGKPVYFIYGRNRRNSDYVFCRTWNKPEIFNPFRNKINCDCGFRRSCSACYGNDYGAVLLGF